MKSIFSLILTLILFFTACNNSGDELKKNKLIFLYKLNTNVSLVREETVNLNDLRKAVIHKNKLVNYLRNSDDIHIIYEWDQSSVLIYEYRNILYENIESMEKIINGEMEFENVNGYEINKMKTRLDNFMEKIDKITSEIDLE